MSARESSSHHLLLGRSHLKAGFGEQAAAAAAAPGTVAKGSSRFARVPHPQGGGMGAGEEL